MVDIVRPVYGEAWASVGEKVSPTLAKIQGGWIQEMMPYQWENFLQNRQDTALLYMLQKGVPEWDASQEYIAGKSVVTYQTNLYISVLDSTNVLPTVQASWKKLNPSTSSSGLVTVAGGGTGASTAAEARTNLGLGSVATATAPTSNGVVVRTTADTLVSRSITGTTNNIVVTNGDGVAGNININTGSNVALLNTDSSWTSTGSIRLPSGSTSQQGASTPGCVRFNLETDEFHGAYSDGWKVLARPASAEQTPITDVGNFYTSSNVEGALQEVGLKAGFVKAAILSYSDYAAASAAAATLPDGQLVAVADEQKCYSVSSGALVFKTSTAKEVTPFDFEAIGDGIANDTAALVAAASAGPVNLLGRTYEASSYPSGTFYNGSILVGGFVYKVPSNQAIISSTTDTGGIGSAYGGGLIPIPTVPGRTTPDLYALIASQGCRSDGPARAVNMAAIYSRAAGNLSANIAARQSRALQPQSVNLATEECDIDTGSRQANIASVISYSEGVSAGNLMSRASRASGWEAANVASNASTAGSGSGARLLVNVTAGVVTSIDVLAGGQRYIAPTIEITDRRAQGVGATATATVVGGVITSVTVTSGGSGYTDIVDGVNAHVYTGRTQGNLASNSSWARGNQAATVAAANSSADGDQSAVLASNRSTASGTNSAVIACGPIAGGSGFIETQAIGPNSACIAGGGNIVRQQYGAAIGAAISESDAIGAVVFGRRVLNNQTRSIALGDSGAGGASSANRKFHALPNGALQISGALTQNQVFTDIAKMFENVEPSAIPVGALVAWEGRKVRLAVPGDTEVSAHSRTYAMLLGDSTFTWAGRYLTDEFGEKVMGEVWDEDAGGWDESLNDGAGGWVGGYVIGPLESPAFAPSAVQVPRSERRDEWTPVALLGEVHVRVDASVAVNDYIVPVSPGIGGKSMSQTRMRCMEIRQLFDPEKGYAVALCLIR